MSKVSSHGQSCATCHKTGKLSTCSGCTAIFYCSSECQNSHWKVHKTQCAHAKTAKTEGWTKVVVKEGEGVSPPKGSHVSVHYVGTLLDGSQFDSSRERGKQFVFTLGKGEVIQGWDKGVASMKVGERCFLYCNPEHAYGAYGSPPDIPANATLVFDVELFSFA